MKNGKTTKIWNKNIEKTKSILGVIRLLGTLSQNLARFGASSAPLRGSGYFLSKLRTFFAGFLTNAKFLGKTRQSDLVMQNHCTLFVYQLVSRFVNVGNMRLSADWMVRLHCGFDRFNKPSAIV